jgi:2-dehydropantoate 2-reductase
MLRCPAQAPSGAPRPPIALRPGFDVVLIDQWPAHVEAMRRVGLPVVLPDREQPITVEAHRLCDL